MKIFLSARADVTMRAIIGRHLSIPLILVLVVRYRLISSLSVGAEGRSLQARQGNIFGGQLKWATNANDPDIQPALEAILQSRALASGVLSRTDLRKAQRSHDCPSSWGISHYKLSQWKGGGVLECRKALGQDR